jgi:hypothetical protein
MGNDLLESGGANFHQHVKDPLLYMKMGKLRRTVVSRTGIVIRGLSVVQNQK